MSATLEPKEARDLALESDIDAAYDRMVAAKSNEAQHQAFKEMAVLIRRRSPDQIIKMELERRLLRRQVVA